MTRAARQVVGRSGGKDVTEADLERMVSESEAGYDVDEMLRRRGPPAWQDAILAGTSSSKAAADAGTRSRSYGLFRDLRPRGATR